MKTLIACSLALLLVTAAWAEKPKFKYASDVETAFANQQSEMAQIRAELASLRALQDPAIDAYDPAIEADLTSYGCGGESCQRGYYALYENVIVQPFFTRSTAYYLEEPVNDGQVEVPFNWDVAYSPRIELGYASACSPLGARVRYWYYDNDADLNAVDANGDITVGFADDSSDLIGIDDAENADFSHRLRVDIIDWEVTMHECNRVYSAGIRYARMQQTYRGIENAPGNDEFFARHDFEGVGLTAAAEYNQPWRNGLTVFAKARGSVLYGESDFRAANVPTTAEIVGENEQDLLAIAELQLGADWRTCTSNGSIFFITAAIEAQYWASAGTGGPGNNAVYDEGNYQNSNPTDADMGFLGLTFGTGWEF